MTAEQDTVADAHQRTTAADAGLTKFNAETLKGMQSSALVSSNGAAFVPATMAEAMELGKLMCMSNFVPKHLRQAPGDCLAVVLQAQRWGMDPFAVANKTYFVQDRIAYEAQLVTAVLNTRAPLDGRLQVSWEGKDNFLTCKVSGKIKGDPTDHTVWQEIGTITVKNSPLWKSSPRQQLAYYTMRMWARLFCPEVLLGVYTEDEVMDMGPAVVQEDGSHVIPPKPTRDSVKESRGATETIRKEAVAADQQYRDIMRGDVLPEQSGGATQQPTQPFEPKALSKQVFAELVKAGTVEAVDKIAATYQAQINALESSHPKIFNELVEGINGKREALGK